jgi:predicted transcriptional regulator
MRAVPTKAEVRRNIRPDALISFVDGGPYKILKRHLRAHGISPTEYRGRFGLPGDYPMVASDYAGPMSEVAKAAWLDSRGREARKPPSRRR